MMALAACVHQVAADQESSMTYHNSNSAAMENTTDTAVASLLEIARPYTRR